MSSSNSETLDQRDNSVSEDSTAMTIEYLRARLLSERSVSRAARLRSEEVTKRVLQLEEQLKIVNLQRKRAEKATAEVLSILEDHGISDVSEAMDSSSDEVEICGSNNASDITNGQEGATSIRSSEVESAQLQRTNLSWKSGHRSQNSSRLKHIDSGRRRRDSFSPKNSTNRMGKSCRRNRHQEIRSALDAPNCSNLQLQAMEQGSPCIKERDTLDVPDLRTNQIANRHFLSEDGGYQDMEGAVQHQEQLIRRYEAEENAQIEWEEKFKQNNTSHDTIDPANNSDVTEERDDVKSSGEPYSASALLDPDKDGSNAPDVNPSLKEKDSEIAYEMPMPEARTSSSGNSSQLQVENHNPILASQGTTVDSCADDTSSGSMSLFAPPPNDVGSILAALQQAKFSLKQKLDIQYEATSAPNSSGSSGFNMADHYRRIDSRNAYFSSPYMEPNSTTLSSGQLHPSYVSSAESISRQHPANSPFKSSAVAGISSTTRFADLDLRFTSYPFNADHRSTSRFSNLDLHGNNSHPFSRTATYPVNHFSSNNTPRLPFDVTSISTLHKNDRLHSAFRFPSHDDSKGLPPTPRLFMNDDRNVGYTPSAHLSTNDQSKRNLYI